MSTEAVHRAAGPRSTWTRAGQGFFALTALVGALALLLQLVLVVQGSSVLVSEERPGLGVRLLRLVGYFTIQSNLLVVLGCAGLALGRDAGWLRWVRTASLLGITVTGVVHWFLLRPLLDLHGASALADALLHLVVPVMAVLGFLVLGPRPWTSPRLAATTLAWPAAWTVVTLLLGGLTGWYPYPFLDPRTAGTANVALACLAITLGAVVVLAVLVALDRWLPAPLPQERP